MGVIAKGIPRGCQGLLTPVSLGYPLSVFNKNSTLKDRKHGQLSVMVLTSGFGLAFPRPRGASWHHFLGPYIITITVMIIVIIIITHYHYYHYASSRINFRARIDKFFSLTKFQGREHEFRFTYVQPLYLYFCRLHSFVPHLHSLWIGKHFDGLFSDKEPSWDFVSELKLKSTSSVC